MRFGLYLPNYGVFGDVHRLIELASDAEEAGWDGVFIWDHIAAFEEDAQKPLPLADPWIALAGMAMRTQRIRIGTTVTALPRRRPWKLARETVTLDHLSRGRFILGVGIGLGNTEWDDLGEEDNLIRRGQMLDEGLDILEGLWSGQTFSYAGRHYAIKAAQFLPTPLQQPRIPIWVGGFWPNKAPCRRMARWDGMFPLFDVFGAEQDAVFSACCDYVRAQRPDPSTTFDVIKMGVTLVDDPPQTQQQIKTAADAGATWWLELLMPEVYDFGPNQPEALSLLKQRVLNGPPVAVS